MNNRLAPQIFLPSVNNCAACIVFDAIPKLSRAVFLIIHVDHVYFQLGVLFAANARYSFPSKRALETFKSSFANQSKSMFLLTLFQVLHFLICSLFRHFFLCCFFLGGAGKKFKKIKIKMPIADCLLDSSGETKQRKRKYTRETVQSGREYVKKQKQEGVNA